jgi:hypothetical protein
MNEGFINFSRLQLNESPQSSIAVEKQGSESAAQGGQTQRDDTNRRRESQGLQMAAKTGSPTQATRVQKNVVEHLSHLRSEKETLKLNESLKSDWRAELQEEFGDEPGEPAHPYVKVMPNIRYKQIEAEKELRKTAKMEEAWDAFAEGFKKFPKHKVQDKAATKPDTAKGELQARRMDRARVAHTDDRTKDDAQGAVKEREQDNRKAGLEKLIKKTPTHKSKAYELEGQRRRDLNKRAGRTSKKHPKSED